MDAMLKKEMEGNALEKLLAELLTISGDGENLGWLMMFMSIIAFDENIKKTEKMKMTAAFIEILADETKKTSLEVQGQSN